MWAKKKQSGFTLVELLIVIVVIAILAAITVVAYNGVQQRARTTSRISAVRSIQKALEMYRVTNGVYPPNHGMYTDQPAGFSPVFGTSYEYSVATSDTWMKGLRLSGLISQPVLDPINDNFHYFVYITYGANGVGSCPEPFYMLMAYGWEGGTATMPSDARTLNCSLSGVVTAGWIQSSDAAVFSNLNHPTGS
jgi:prepilin-type N-terminal cleavage/methylation domain-containing protein